MLYPFDQLRPRRRFGWRTKVDRTAELTDPEHSSPRRGHTASGAPRRPAKHNYTLKVADRGDPDQSSSDHERAAALRAHTGGRLA
jgi:hypothetical protein